MALDAFLAISITTASLRVLARNPAFGLIDGEQRDVLS
jgi:hypothetical protein